MRSARIGELKAAQTAAAKAGDAAKKRAEDEARAKNEVERQRLATGAPAHRDASGRLTYFCASAKLTWPDTAMISGAVAPASAS